MSHSTVSIVVVSLRETIPHSRSEWATILAALAVLVLSSAGRADEISTNGVGGGAWADPATWRGKAVPGPGDEVVIRKHDIVVFDRIGDKGDGKPTCRKLQIDPKGGLTFKPGSGKMTLTVAEGVESFGAIRLDATRSASDHFELRLVGETAAKRQVKLGKGGALLLFGRPGLPEGRRNVALLSLAPAAAKDDPSGLVEAEGGATIDWMRAVVSDVKLVAKKIDNSGGKQDERIRVADCLFSGHGRIQCHTCDSPEIARNVFEYKGEKRIEEPAISTLFSPLAEIKGNTVKGGFSIGIAINYQGDGVLLGNTVEKCGSGVQGGYGLPNTMIKNLTVRGCEVGLKLEGGSGVIEDSRVDGATTALNFQNFTTQLTNFRITNLAKKGQAVLQEGGGLTLLNSDVRPADVKFVPPAPSPTAKPPAFPTVCLHYAVVAVKGAPVGSLVEVRTTAPAPAAGAADPNVRNSPAPLVDGLTPLPGMVGALTVKAWSLDAAGKAVAAPEYAVKVLAPAPKEGAERPLLRMVSFRPADHAVRAADDKKPTLEVSLK